MKKLPLSKSFLGQHFKKWYEIDGKNWDNPVNVYGVVNDLDRKSIEDLERWLKLGLSDSN